MKPLFGSADDKKCPITDKMLTGPYYKCMVCKLIVCIEKVKYTAIGRCRGDGRANLSSSENELYRIFVYTAIKLCICCNNILCFFCNSVNFTNYM